MYFALILCKQELHFIIQQSHHYIHVEWFCNIVRYAKVISVNLINILSFGSHHDNQVFKILLTQ
ncbi:hypothetical protein D3C78_1777790 [compost metagenome]